MQPTPLQNLGKLSDAELIQKKKEEICSYAAYFDAVLKALTPDVVKALGSYASQLSDGSAELSLYGRLAATIDREKLWNSGSGVNGDKSWALGVGEQLVAIVHDNDRRFVHRLQEGKHEELARRYDPKYESMDNPRNYNSFWLWPIQEYTPVVVSTEEFFQKRTWIRIAMDRIEFDSELTLYERVLMPEDIAKHPIFAQCGKERIEKITASAYRDRKSFVDAKSRTTQANYEAQQRILAALAGK